MLLKLIRKWLKKRLGIYVSTTPQYFYEMTRDGTLLARILHYYNIVTNDELQLIEETKDPAVANANYKNHIKEWLKRIELELTDSDIEEISHGDNSAAASIFYELYMKLENKKGTVYEAKPNKHRFLVEKVGKPKREDSFFEINPLCEPLIKQWDVINWEKDHLAAVMSKYAKSRSEYADYLEQKRLSEESEPSKMEIEDTLLLSKVECTNYTYEELIAQQKAALRLEPFQPNKGEAKRIMKQIKQRNKQRAERTAFRIQLEHELLADVWKKIEETEEQEFDKVVCEKLLKQSMHEKEIEDKLLNIRKQKDVFIQHRKDQDELEKKRRDEEFIRRLFEEDLEERMQFHEERMELIAEHRRLYEEKLKMRVLKHEKVCRDAVEDIVDLAIKTAEYKEQYGMEPDEYTRRNWAALFIKQQPIFDLLTSSQDLKRPHEDITEELEEIYRREITRQDILDEEEFIDYINFRNMWQIEEDLEEFVESMQLGMNCLGYAVHKLLLEKYPLPIPQKPDLPTGMEISVCASLNDLSRLDYLQRLLELRNIKIIQVEDALNFCIKAYEVELKTEYDEPLPEEEYLKELTPKKAKSEKGDPGGKRGKGGKKGKAGKKGKGSKKDKDSKKSKGKKDKGSKKGKKGKKDGNKIEVVECTFEEKQAQTPRLFPCEKVIFSNKAKLGRIAKQILGQEESLDDRLLVDMFVEYLMSMADIKGWVLLNYPNNYQQAALLEQALSGKPVPKEYYDKVLNKESLTSVEVETIETEEDVIVETQGVVKEEPISKNSQQRLTNEKKSKKTLSLIEIKTPKSASQVPSGTSGFSAITMIDDWNITPEEKIARLLPDLKKLAYSSDEENDKTEVKEVDKTCTCVCNPFNESEDDEKAQTQNQEEELSSSDNQSEVKKGQEVESVAKSAENIEIEEEREVKSREECTCFLENDVEEVIKLEQQEQVTQTDILAMEQETAGDDKPLERVVAEDVCEEKRLSKIVPNPRPLEKEEYNTVLTAYIKVQLKEEDEDEDYPIPIYEEFDRKEGMEKFYCDQGCYYLLEYTELSAETIKCLAKMVIGDYSLPLKNSVELFGEHYKQAMLEDGDQKITKKGKVKKEKKQKKKKGKDKSESKVSSKTKGKGKDKKSKASKDKSSKGKKGKKGKKDKKGKGNKKDKSEEEVVIEHEDKEVQVPPVEELEEEEFPEPRPGEPDWEYVNLPIPNDVELCLANFWDNFEENYTKNFRQLFFNKRILLNDIVPFLAKTRETVDEFIARPDQKQHYLREFQKTLNEIDLDLRDDEETKSELLCRIDEFKEKLLEICDSKMRESEEERKNFINQNWLFQQFCEITNTLAIAFQLEIDRLVDTLQFLSDYYTSLITKSLKEGYEFHKQVLPKYQCNEEKSEEFNKLFINIQIENEEKTDFHDYIEQSTNTALAFVESMKPLALKPVADMKKVFEHKEKEKKPKKGAKGLPKFEPDEDVKENADRIFEEWECAINGEFVRMDLHLNVIRNEAFRRFDDIISWIKKIFETIFENISARYENEIASVHKACELLMEAVVEEIIIQPQLSFEGDQLAKIEVTLFPKVSELSVEECIEGVFKVEQLDKMFNILLDLAPSGYIMRKTFLLLIQDMLYQDDEELDTETPKLWRNMSISALNTLLEKIFDDEKYLYWKDFIVCSLTIPFPTNEELMAVRKQFRQFDAYLTENVTREEFDAVVFWFEDQMGLIKSLIFKMYQTDLNAFNYTAMLLDFCKDEDKILGFVKALELSLGKFICHDESLGKEFATQILEDRVLFEKQKKEHEETTMLAKRAVSLLIDRIVDQCEGPEGLTLEEIGESRSSLNVPDKSSKSGSKQSHAEESAGEEKFFYTPVGFEARDDTQICYFLPLELVLIVVSTEVSWSSKVDNPESRSFKDQIVEIFDECRNENFNNVVLAHEFLNCEKLRALFDTTNKFLAHNPVRIAKRILYDEPASVVEPEEFLAEMTLSECSDVNEI